MTATDFALTNVATIGVGSGNPRNYFFQRNDPLNTKDDFDPNASSSSTATTSNLQLFNDLVNRGNVPLPGYGSSFSAKYPGANWPQIMLEITDFIRGLNAVDPNSALAPFAAGNSVTGVGRGFIIPLTWTYGTGSGQMTLRGLGRCPTLSSLTLVLYVSGFGFKNGSVIDYGVTPDNFAGTSWKANFQPGSPEWKNLKSELIRAFVVPCTFQPGCAYPEVSDGCTIQISGLDSISVNGNANCFGFAPMATSLPLGTPLKALPADRAWGGNEGPVSWRQTSDALANGSMTNYPFAGANAFSLSVLPNTPAAMLDPKTGGQGWPPTSSLGFSSTTLTVTIRDLKNNPLQTFSVNFPAFSISAHELTNKGECDHADAVPPLPSIPGWSTNAACAVAPSWYMSLQHRLQTSQNSRALMIQAGDVSRSVEANTDLRVIAGLTNVPSAFFSPIPTLYVSPQVNAMGGSHAQNIRFADGTSACFAPYNSTGNSSFDNTGLVASAHYAKTITPLITATDWVSQMPVPYDQFTSPSCSVPTGTSAVYTKNNTPGDWDTGPGFAPDGAQINLPDSGTTNAPSAAYFSLTGGSVGAPTQRTPNALVPSPVIFGSLPTGINPASPAQSAPWQTLLFCPYPAANKAGEPYTGHPGAATPPDHLILDNFWMPVVEPYAISTCLATAGKINLNDQIAPFTYLHRNTALRALLDALRIPAIPASNATTYKAAGTPLTSIWNPVDEDATIAQIESRFANNSVDAYLSESEICTVPLVPGVQNSPFSTNVSTTQTALASFWSSGGGQLTGDNLRELPYAQLYGRLTTRSNSYTVHVRVQVLKKLPQDPNQNIWHEGVDLVLGDWRGSYEIERYLDPTVAAPQAGRPLQAYKYRIVSARQFAP